MKVGDLVKFWSHEKEYLGIVVDTDVQTFRSPAKFFCVYCPQYSPGWPGDTEYYHNIHYDRLEQDGVEVMDDKGG